MIFEYKKKKKTLKVIAFFIEKWEEIEPWHLDIWIASWINLFLRNTNFCQFWTHSGGHKVGSKMKILSISCDHKHLSISKFVTLILDIHENHLLPAFKPNLTFITGVVAPKSPQNGPNLIQNVKRSTLSVKSTTRNTHKLKLRDPKAMGGWPYYRLFENFCCPFGTAPEWNLSPIFQIKLKRTRNLQGLASFWIMSVFK